MSIEFWIKGERYKNVAFLWVFLHTFFSAILNITTGYGLSYNNGLLAYLRLYEGLWNNYNQRKLRPKGS